MSLAMFIFLSILVAFLGILLLSYALSVEGRQQKKKDELEHLHGEIRLAHADKVLKETRKALEDAKRE